MIILLSKRLYKKQNKKHQEKHHTQREKEQWENIALFIFPLFDK